MSTWRPQASSFAVYKKQVFAKAAAVCDFIYQIGEYEKLREPSEEILLENITSPEIQAKFQYCKDCLVKYRKLTGHGRGITGVQVGIPERFSVIYTSEELLIIINPVVTKKSKKLLKYSEMCMSTALVIVPTIRPAWIEFEYYDETGNQRYWNTKDDTDLGRMMNRVFQHEIDHMEGIINIDRIKYPKEIILESDPDYYNNAKFEEVELT